MAGRWRDPAAFRADPSAAPAVRPSRRQAVALMVVLVLVAGATALVSFLIRPDRARSFDLLHGSMYLQDALAPVAVDLASGRPTVRLFNAQQLVDVRNSAAVRVVPLSDGTLLLNPDTGTFNVLDATGFVLKSDGGVPLPKRAGSTALAVANGSSAYIVQTGGVSGTAVYLVDSATVVRASATAKAVKPRASITMPDPGSADPAKAASADGDLWLLVGSGEKQKIRQLSVPADSSPGATLTATDRGTASGLSAIATATTSDGTAVGVASAEGIQVFQGAKDVKTVAFPRRLSALTRIFPVSNASGRLAFLLQDGSTWKFASVAADGSALHAPSDLNDVAAGASLTSPAESNGLMYTMDTGNRDLFTIDRNGTVGRIDGAASYPAGDKYDASPSYEDSYVTARDSRVIINSPSHQRAIVVFTDGSRAPLTIQKSAGVRLDATLGALALAKIGSGTNPGKTPVKTPSGSKPLPQPAQPINNQINCKYVTQKPHTPVIANTIPASRSAEVDWTYPTPDTADCVPSTWLVQVTQIGDSAPAAPSNVKVQGNEKVNLIGLFPSTSYKVTVQGFINGTGGPASQPAVITTGPEGPAAPKNVLASTDSAGNWTVTWSSCGTSKSGCVPATAWKVIPEFCDGRGLSTPPASFSVGADPTSVEQPPGVLHGGDALLGRGVRFQVEGVGESGTIGQPSKYTACTYSWTPPVAKDITVTASTPPQTTGQDATTTTVSVRLARGAVHDLGGIGGNLTYKLLDSSGNVVTIKGPTSSLSETLDGVRAGARYSVAVVATPPRHPDAAVTIGPVPVQPAVAVFPQPTVSATFENTSFSDGRLIVSFSLPPGTDTHGETFDLVNSSLTCGSTATPLSGSSIAPDQNMVFDNIDRFTYNSMNSPCTVSLQLVQNQATSTDPPLYGAATRSASSDVQIEPPSLTATASDFQAQWAGSVGQPQVLVTYHGNDHLLLASGWTITVTNGTTADCGTTHNAPTATIDVARSCVRDGGTFTVSVDYNYILSHPHFDGIAVSGTAPQPVDPNKITYTATWPTPADPTDPQVVLTYTGSESTNSFGTFNWTETVTSDLTPGVTCGSSTAPAVGDLSIGVDLTKCPATSSDGSTQAHYSIEVVFDDPNYGVHYDKPVPVDGTPPA